MRRFWHDWTDQARPTAARGVFGEGRTMAEVMRDEVRNRGVEFDPKRKIWRWRA